MKFINNIGGLQTILIAVSGVLVSKFAPSIAMSFGKLISMVLDFPILIGNIRKFTAETGSLSDGLKKAGISASVAQIAFNSLTTIITLGIIAWNNYKQAEEEAEQARKQSVENAKQEISSLESLEEQINNESLSREDLIKLIQGSSISAYEDEISALQNVNDMRQAAIDKINEEKMARAKEVIDTGLTDYEEALKSQQGITSGYDEFNESTGIRLTPYGDGRLDLNNFFGKDLDLTGQIQALKDYKDALTDVRSETEQGSFDWNQYTKEIKNVESGISELESQQKDNLNIIDDYNNALTSIGKKYDKTSGKIVDMTDAEKEAYKASKDIEKSSESAGNETEKMASKMYDLGSYSSEAMNSMNEATKEQQDIISSLASDIDNITGAYQTAVDALYEYNQQGYLSVDTYSQLMQVAPEYLAMMIDENGQLYANADAVTTAYQAKVYLMGIEAAEAQVNLAASRATNQGAGAYAALGSQAINTAGSLWELVKARMADKIAAVEDPRDLEALENRINAINNLTQSTIKNAKTTTASIKPTQASTGATKKNTGARKGNADATKAQTDALKRQKQALEEEADALEKQIDDYEIVIDYVKDLLKEEQEALEEQKDAELDAIQDKIDALEKEQEAMEENVDSQIEVLEKQKEEQEEYWDSQIDAIQDANDALEENMELQRLQEALASAKTQKVKVLKDGKFVYAEDEEAISKAEQDLADYEMQLSVQRQIEELERLKEEALDSLEDQIQKLEDYRDKQNKNYEQQLKDLQDHYNKIEAEYDIRIKQYDKWLKQFEDMLNASAKRHAKILYDELVGEQGNWDARIVALSNFVKRYEQKKNQLDGIKSQIEAIDNQIRSLQSSARNAYNATQGYANGAINAANLANQSLAKAKASTMGWQVVGTLYGSKSTAGTGSKNWSYSDALNMYYSMANQIIGTGANKHPMYSNIEIKRFAKGVYSVPEDQIALVADPMRPSNRELVIGSKINQGDGVLTSLKKGTGVIPSGRNLTENLINLARWSQNGGIEKTFTTMTNSSSKIINIDNINLSEVKNGEEFVEYLENNFMNDSIQFSNIRR